MRNKPSLDEPIHIGKDSAGWLFCFERHIDTWHDPPVAWVTWESVREWLQKYTVESKEYVIMNEYEEIVSYDDFVKLVEDKQNDDSCRGNLLNFKFCFNMNGYRFMDGKFR